MKLELLFEARTEEHYKISLHEALSLTHDKKNNMLAVVSTKDTEKEAKKETYRNRGLLKSNGFKWSGTNWTIDTDQFEKAKKVITQANKTDYIISKLEDLQEFIGGRSADPRKDMLNNKIQDYIDTLANETDETAAAAEIKKYLDFFAGFHQYSYHNKILIFLQMPSATKVASYKKWKEKGRQVRKGEKGISILVPIFRKGENPMSKKNKEASDEDKVTGSPVGFKVGSVFDFSQTEPVSEEGDVDLDTDWWATNEPSEVADKLYDLIEDAAMAEGIRISRDESHGEELGYSKGGHINVKSDVEGVQKAATLAHEYAHELMHWRDKSKFYAGDEVKGNAALKELQAESVAYVVCKHYGLPVAHHTKYLALWRASGSKIKNNIEIISKVAHHIIKGIDRQADKDMVDAA
jgi:antirestriction protein ArdC